MRVVLVIVIVVIVIPSESNSTPSLKPKSGVYNMPGKVKKYVRFLNSVNFMSLHGVHEDMQPVSQLCWFLVSGEYLLCSGQ